MHTHRNPTRIVAMPLVLLIVDPTLNELAIGWAHSSESPVQACPHEASTVKWTAPSPDYLHLARTICRSTETFHAPAALQFAHDPAGNRHRRHVYRLRARYRTRLPLPETPDHGGGPGSRRHP